MARHRFIAFAASLALLLGLSAAGSTPTLASGGSVAVVATGSTSIVAEPEGTTDGGLANDTPEQNAIDKRLLSAGIDAARVSADHVPNAAPSAVAGAGAAAGFNGISHRDQRLASNGNQFSLEPPDQGLCVGNGKVLETINLALRVFDTQGHALTATTALNAFFKLPPSIDRTKTPPVRGPFLSDPKCYFDTNTGRFFLTVLQWDRFVPAAQQRTSLRIAVSQTGDPTGSWFTYAIDTTNDGTRGTPSRPACPCLGDQPLIGADASGFYITTNEFPLFTNGFNGALVYAMSKTALAAGSASANAQLIVPPALLDGEPAFSIQPATTPAGGAYAAGNGGTEYFLSDFFVNLADKINLWALTNTNSLNTSTPTLKLSLAAIDSEIYGFTPAAEQPDGPRPLAAALAAAGAPASQTMLPLLDTNDVRMNQVVFAAGTLWSAVDTVVKTPNGFPVAGIAWFIVAPSVDARGAVSGTVTSQGYVAVNRNYVMYPSIGVTAAGKAAMTFSLAGPDFYPSAAYVLLDATNGTGDVHVAAAGAGPDDGFTGYGAEGSPDRVGRWGDYSAAVGVGDDVWFAAEYIPNAKRTLLANWGTFVAHVAP